jgi:hypothetical protein
MTSFCVLVLTLQRNLFYLQHSKVYEDYAHLNCCLNNTWSSYALILRLEKFIYATSCISKILYESGFVF